jgi:site-specific recombinase XerD
MEVESTRERMVPSITIYVRHAAECRYSGDETWKRCDCRKHLRWTFDGQQYRRSAKTRSWGQAEERKRELEDSFKAGGRPEVVEETRKTIANAIELFLMERKTAGLNASIVKKYERELERFRQFFEIRSKFFPTDINLEMLVQYRGTWDELYPSSLTRQQVQTRLRRFLRFCHNGGWLERVPTLSAITADEPPTMPLSPAEYTKLLAEIPKKFEGDKAARVRALVQLMRHSGLSIRDAVTLQRSEIKKDERKKLVRVVTKRQKTGTHVSVPLPPAVASEILAVQNGKDYLFWTGGGLETSAVTNWQHDLRTLFRSAFGKNTRFTPHCLRDTAACGWLTAGIPMEEVSKLLGHTSIKTTEKHYSAWAQARQDRLDSLVVAAWKGDAAHV